MIESPQGQLGNICSSGNLCPTGTGHMKERRCPPNYFCPTGTAHPFTGTVANDALNRNLDSSTIHPKRNLTNLRFSSSLDYFVTSDHSTHRLNGNDDEPRRRFRIDWKNISENIMNPWVIFHTLGT